MLKSNCYSAKMFTEYIHELMLQKKDFMVFPDNNQILVENEVTEWNNIHGLTNDTERIMCHYVYDTDKTKELYRIKHTNTITTLLIPILCISQNYEDFIKALNLLACPIPTKKVIGTLIIKLHGQLATKNVAPL